MRLSPAVRRGLQYWAGHCRAIHDQMREERDAAIPNGGQVALTDEQFGDVTQALNYMIQHGESWPDSKAIPEELKVFPLHKAFKQCE